MEREIKFRFWDKDLNKMVHRKPLTYDFSAESIIPLQFTGLKDKNGIEIYEGDLLIDEDGSNTIVVWIDDWAMFGCLFKDEYFAFKNKGIIEIDETMFWTFPIENNLLKVIGNIYEQQNKKT